MDLVDLIEEKRFLGQEFLTWLWWKSEERGGSVLVSERGEDVTVVFEKHMLLEYGDGQNSERIICSGLQSEMKEARTGLRMAKKLEQARIQLVLGDLEWNFTLAAAMMEFRSVKLPKTAKTDGSHSENQEETEGMILERIYLFEELTSIVDDLFRGFLKVRISPEWDQELQKIREWVHQDYQ